MSKRKNPSHDADNLNADFCNFLIELSEYEKNVSRNIHKYNAYKKAAGILASHHKRIESGDEAKKLNGIGDKISKKIDEFIQTGKLRKLENIHQDADVIAINLLTRVSGIGPVKAAELVKNGIKSIENLKHNQDKLNHHQIIGLNGRILKFTRRLCASGGYSEPRHIALQCLKKIESDNNLESSTERRICTNKSTIIWLHFSPGTDNVADFRVDLEGARNDTMFNNSAQSTEPFAIFIKYDSNFSMFMKRQYMKFFTTNPHLLIGRVHHVQVPGAQAMMKVFIHLHSIHKYFDDFEKKIPRSEIEAIECELKKTICELDSEFTITICGSYRRGKAESGDIDALITHPSMKVGERKKKHGEKLLKNIVDTLNKSLVTDVISMGDTKFMGVCRLSEEHPFRRLDIRLIPCEQYYCAVLYFTGSDVFNKTMRAHALEQGFTLNEYSLRPIGVTGVPGEPVPITSEEDIFEYINFPYKKPEERNM